MNAPFPYFGGKSPVAADVWAALGDVDNYVEPFAGSLAVLLNRPHQPKTETVNDVDGLLANFWRAVAKEPDEVARHADWPVNEADLEARHLWLARRKGEVRDRLGDPDWFDTKAAGWWVWGACAWIGSGWCSGTGPWSHDGTTWTHLGNAGQGINRKLPHLGDAGRGINRQLPHLGSAGQGINRQLPHLGNAGRGIREFMAVLADRLRRTRVACGDWSRVCGPSVTWRHGLTGVFLDPPYSSEGRAVVYSHDCGSVARDVTAWALDNGQRRDMRIVVAGYDDEHGPLTDAGWRVTAWKAHGGFGSQGNGRGRENAHRERLWFSPHCISPMQERLL